MPNAGSTLSPTLRAVLVFAVAFAIRVPFASTSNLSPDAVDYIDIARNIAHGAGVTQNIKWHYFTSASVPRPAWGERPVLLSLLMAPLLALFDSVIFLQTFNCLLGALGVMFLYLWVRAVGGEEKIAL